MTMYTNTKSVRETLARDSNVNVFTKWLNSGDDDDIHHESTEHRTANTSRLQPTIREMIRTADAFVYVSDSQKSTTEENDEVWLNRCQECLYLILEEAVLSEDSSRKRPLLILSCHNEAQMLSYSCRDIIHRFQLKLIERPWNVSSLFCDIKVKSLKKMNS